MSALQRTSAFVVAAVMALATSACGDDPPAAPPRTEPAAKPGTPSAEIKPGGQAPPVPGKGGPQQLATYPKAPDDYRANLTREMLTPDPTGDVNRDPFRSYVIDEAPVGPITPSTAEPDECDRSMVAEGSGLRDLTLTGIVKRGTKAFALFEDQQHEGYIAERGECLSKDKARIKEVGSSSIIITVRGEAPPGAPAPPPREEEWKLHPEELDLTPENLQRLLR
jgi:hypothetical protein